MKFEPNQSLFYSSKLNLKLREQFFFYKVLTSEKVILIIDLFFSNFTYLNVKLLISSLFVLDQLLGNNSLEFKISKYKIKREKRIALTIRWYNDSIFFLYKLFLIILPKIGKGNLYFSSIEKSTNNIKISWNKLLVLIPYLQNYRQFYRFFEFGYISLYFSFLLLPLKHNLILKNYLAFLGFLII